MNLSEERTGSWRLKSIEVKNSRFYLYAFLALPLSNFRFLFYYFLCNKLEMKTKQELEELKKDLEIERKKTEVFEKNIAFLEQKLNSEASAAQIQIEETLQAKNSLQKQYDGLFSFSISFHFITFHFALNFISISALLSRNSQLEQEFLNAKEMLSAESAARTQLEESSKEMEQEIKRFALLSTFLPLLTLQ